MLYQDGSIEKITEHQFDQWADKYDRSIWNTYFIKSIKRATRLANIQKPSKVLDLGCGTGNLSIMLAINPLIKEIVGIDISQKMISQAKLKQRNLGVSEKVKFLVGNSNNLNFTDNYFNYVFCLNSFHHYSNQNKVLREVFRVLKKGGRLILLDPFRDNILREIWTIFLKKIFKEEYANYHSKYSIKTMLLNSGFHNLHQETFLYFTLFSLCEKKG